MATEHDLKIELETYEAKKKELLDRAGKFVLIQGRDVVGVWETYDDALQTAYDKFGVDKPFLVKQIEVLDSIKYITRDVSCQVLPQQSCQPAH